MGMTRPCHPEERSDVRILYCLVSWRRYRYTGRSSIRSSRLANASLRMTCGTRNARAASTNPNNSSNPRNPSNASEASITRQHKILTACCRRPQDDMRNPSLPSGNDLRLSSPSRGAATGGLEVLQLEKSEK
jgi:hypothetical protein